MIICNKFVHFCGILQHFAALGIKDYTDNSQKHSRQLNQPSSGYFIGLTAENWPCSKTFYIFAVFCSIMQHFAAFQIIYYADTSLQHFRHLIVTSTSNSNGFPAANQPIATNMWIFAAFCSILQHFAVVGMKHYADTSQKHSRQLN